MNRRSEAWELELWARSLRGEWWAAAARPLRRAAGRLAKAPLDTAARIARPAADAADHALAATPPAVTALR